MFYGYSMLELAAATAAIVLIGAAIAYVVFVRPSLLSKITLPSLSSLPSIPRAKPRSSTADGEADATGTDTVLGMTGMQLRLLLALTVFALGVYAYIFIYTQQMGAPPWPIGPWRGWTIFGFPAYWGVFFICFFTTVVGLPLYVYFFPFGGGTIGRALWIIAALSMGGTLFDRGADGRYHAYPLKLGKPRGPEPVFYLTPDPEDDDFEEDDDEYRYQETPREKVDYDKAAFGFIRGAWWEIKGPIEHTSRLAFKPVAHTWEKTGPAIEDIEARELGKPRSEWIVEEYGEWKASEQAEKEERERREHSIAADGSGIENPDLSILDRDYHILERVGYHYRAFNPFPDGAWNNHYLVDTKRLWEKLQGSAGIHLIEKAKERALVEAAHSSKVSQALTFGMVFFALIMGVFVAWIVAG